LKSEEVMWYWATQIYNNKEFEDEVKSGLQQYDEGLIPDFFNSMITLFT